MLALFGNGKIVVRRILEVDILNAHVLTVIIGNGVRILQFRVDFLVRRINALLHVARSLLEVGNSHTHDLSLGLVFGDVEAVRGHGDIPQQKYTYTAIEFARARACPMARYGRLLKEWPLFLRI